MCLQFTSPRLTHLEFILMAEEAAESKRVIVKYKPTKQY